MQIDTFIITAAQITTPPAYTIVILVIVFIVIIGIGVALQFKMREYYHQTIIATILGFMVLVGGTYLDKKTNPLPYTSHLTCAYTLVSTTESITHLTLVPRDSGGCAKVGTEITRIKTDSNTKFYQDFQIPN